MYKIVVDIETTGLPVRIPGYPSNPADIKNYENCRIVELGYYILDENNSIKNLNELIIKPSDFIISKEVTEIHGISHDYAVKKGKDIQFVLNILETLLNKYNCILFISHNVDFDKNIIISECYRLNYLSLINKLTSMSDFCTMKDNKLFSKWVKLSVLYQELFNKKIVVEHRALSDVKICYECYCELYNREQQNYMVLRDNKKIKKNS